MKKFLPFLSLFLIQTACANELIALAEPAVAPFVQEEKTDIFKVHPSQEVLLNALKWVGVKYKLGGNTEDGLDCSGFVRLVFKESLNKELPRTARAMSEVGKKILKENLSPGDLIFFNTLRRPFSHVGIYLGDNYFLHAPRKGAHVRLEKLSTAYWQKRFNGIRRIF